MNRRGEKHIEKLRSILMEVIHRIVLQAPLYCERGMAITDIKDNDCGVLVYHDKFKFDKSAADWLHLYCEASKEDPELSIGILLPQEIPVDMVPEALQLANRMNIRHGGPAVIYLKSDGRFMVATRIGFSGYSSEGKLEAESHSNQVAAVINQFAEVVNATRALYPEVKEMLKNVPTSSTNAWQSLVPDYTTGRCEITALTSSEAILKLRGENDSMDLRLEHYARCGWRSLCQHDWRVFLIRSPKNKSVVWMTWHGRRGGRWHIGGHYALGAEKPTATHKEIANNIIERYQAAWDGNDPHE